MSLIVGCGCPCSFSWIWKYLLFFWEEAGYGNTWPEIDRPLVPVRSLEIRWTLGRGLNSASIRSWWVEQIVSTFVGWAGLEHNNFGASNQQTCTSLLTSSQHSQKSVRTKCAKNIGVDLWGQSKSYKVARCKRVWPRGGGTLQIRRDRLQRWDKMDVTLLFGINFVRIRTCWKRKFMHFAMEQCFCTCSVLEIERKNSWKMR